MRIDFLFVEAAIEKYSTKIDVEKFCYAQHWSCPGIAVKTFENTSKGITKKTIFLKRILKRILTTKCELKLESEVRLVFYRYLTLFTWHLNLLSFSKEIKWNYMKIL